MNKYLRNGQMVEDYLTGNFTLQKLGDKYGISRERVRQIISIVIPEEIRKEIGKKNLSLGCSKPNIKKICPVCKNEFEVKPYKDREYCNEECRKKTFQTPEERRLKGIIFTKRWYIKNRAKAMARMKIYSKKYNERKKALKH